MERLTKILADSVFVVQILILFILVFENRIEVPALTDGVLNQIRGEVDARVEVNDVADL